MRIYLRLFLTLFGIALLLALGRAEPAVAQECDPDVCANPDNNAKARSRHKQVVKKKRSAVPKVKQDYLRY